MNLMYFHHHPALNEPFPEQSGQKRKLNRRQKNRTLSFKISISTNYPGSIHINWFCSMNPDVTNGLDTGGLVGLHWV
jgi:hypothetical protein